ncbi:MAG: zonular occludens toxin domain-containing protein [Nanoarchaeota archaeon]
MPTLQSILIAIVIIAVAFSIAVLVFNYLSLRSKNKTEPKIFRNTSPNYSGLKQIKEINGNLLEFEANLYKKDSSVGLILGARGSGKSALGIRIAENFHSKTNKYIYAIGFSQKDLPPWIKVEEDPEKIRNNSFVLIDEGGVFLSSRDSMKDINKIVSKIILLARHKDLSILFITQNSSNIDINTIRQADYLMLKPSSLLQLDFERKKIKEIYTEVQKDFEKLKSEKGLFYLYSDEFKGFAGNELPSFWSKKVSKTLKNKEISKNY